MDIYEQSKTIVKYKVGWAAVEYERSQFFMPNSAFLEDFCLFLSTNNLKSIQLLTDPTLSQDEGLFT